jgi:hypothetical protein
MERHLLVDSADYWFQAARDIKNSMSERLLYMENALNHTEGALAALQSERTDAKVEARKAAIEECELRLADLRDGKFTDVPGCNDLWTLDNAIAALRALASQAVLEKRRRDGTP